MAIDYAARRAAALAAATSAYAANPTAATKAAERQARNAISAAGRRARMSTLPAVRAAAPALKQPARYRPPAVSGVVERAAARSADLRQRRADVLKNLPDVRNLEGGERLRPVEKTSRAIPKGKTAKGKATSARRIREQAAAQRIQAVGKARQDQLRSELDYGQLSDRLQENMSRAQQAEFRRLSNEIAKGSRQSVAILFDHADGQGLYSAAIERIVASPESRDVDEGLEMLASLAAQARTAAKVYSPAAIGTITV